MPDTPHRPIPVGWPVFACAILLVLCAHAGHAQESDDGCDVGVLPVADLADPAETLVVLARAAGRSNTRTPLLRRSSDRPLRSVCPFGPLRPVDAGEHGWLRATLFPARTRTVFHSGFPADRLNGALWEGRGLSGLMQAGALVRIGPLSAGVVPEVVAHQNRPFRLVEVETGGRSPLAHPFHGANIDLPRRFGDAPGALASLGQSFVRLDLLGLAAGLSNEGIVFGPARHNPLLLGNGAPGFPHLFVGTSGVAGTPLGGIELTTFWGRLRESEHFDDDFTNDERLLSGVAGAWHIPGTEGLAIGGARLFMTNMDDTLGTADLIALPFEALVPNDPDVPANNQVISLFFRMPLRRSGFELYGEWARDDYWESASDLARELDHGQAWTLGFLWLPPAAGESRWGLGGEHTHLRFSNSALSGRGAVTYYVHAMITQGLTHRGQLLAAPIGPGSISTTVELWLIDRDALTTIELRRTTYDIDAAELGLRDLDPDERDRELSLAIRRDLRLGDFWIGAGAGAAHRPNRDYLTSLTGRRGALWDFHASLELAWRPERPILLAR